MVFFPQIHINTFLFGKEVLGQGSLPIKGVFSGSNTCLPPPLSLSLIMCASTCMRDSIPVMSFTEYIFFFLLIQ